VQHKSKVFQFWGYFFAVILDAMNVQAAIGKRDSDAATAKKELQAHTLNVTKNTCDLLVTMHAAGYLSSVWSPSAGTQGLLGLTSGAISTYQNWTKTK
jgi:hypothetical protein